MTDENQRRTTVIQALTEYIKAAEMYVSAAGVAYTMSADNLAALARDVAALADGSLELEDMDLREHRSATLAVMGAGERAGRAETRYREAARALRALVKL